MMKINRVAVASLLLVSTFANPYYNGNAQSASQSEGMLCHVPDAAEKPKEHDHQAMMSQNMAGMVHDHQAMMAKGMVAMGQDPEDGQDQPQAPGKDPDQSYDTPTHRYSPGAGCSAVDPNAKNPRRDGVNPNTVGCKCAKKCVNGQTQEDLTKEKDVYVCKNACYKDRCSCPDPCKS